ncbi:MAG: GIY-YIG nuclease family protein [Candidatus Diapherotrites archaeon]|nr:GIY-YIG nuclease family protein [Candidatus Diapherotrites archaeon]
MPFFVYFLRCADGSLYCGYTKDLKKRLLAHNAGIASKYTKRRLPVEIIYTEELADLSLALKREYALKQLSKFEKERIVREASNYNKTNII